MTTAVKCVILTFAQEAASLNERFIWRRAGHQTWIMFWYWPKCFCRPEYRKLQSTESWHWMSEQICSFVYLLINQIFSDLSINLTIWHLWILASLKVTYYIILLFSKLVSEVPKTCLWSSLLKIPLRLCILACFYTLCFSPSLDWSFKCKWAAAPRPTLETCCGFPPGYHGYGERLPPMKRTDMAANRIAGVHPHMFDPEFDPE